MVEGFGMQNLSLVSFIVYYIAIDKILYQHTYSRNKCKCYISTECSFLTFLMLTLALHAVRMEKLMLIHNFINSNNSIYYVGLTSNGQQSTLE